MPTSSRNFFSIYTEYSPVFQKNLVSLTDLNLDKELKNRPDLFSDEEKEFLLKSNKEIDKSTDLREIIWW